MDDMAKLADQCCEEEIEMSLANIGVWSSGILPNSLPVIVVVAGHQTSSQSPLFSAATEFGENKTSPHGTVSNGYNTIRSEFAIRSAESTEPLSFGGLSSDGCEIHSVNVPTS
jgi:hypothetical protein